MLIKTQIPDQLELFKKFEENIDTIISDINLTQFHLNDILDFFNLSIGMRYSAEKLNTDTYQIKLSDSFSSTLSYLFPLLNNCKKEFNKEHFENYFIIQIKKNISTLIKYASFCEVAPYVWKKTYTPEINGKILRIKYKDNYFESELKDVILTSIATGISATNDIEDSQFYDLHILDTINLKYTPSLNHIIFETIKSKKWYKKYRFDDSTISENIYSELGITKNDYIEFQSFWLGLTTYYIKAFEALIRYVRKNGKENDSFVEHLIFYFSSANIYKNKFYTEFPESMIGLSEKRFNILMKIFSLNVNDKFKLQDGHYPLFIEYEDLYMFSPFNVRSQISPRNLLYLLNKKEASIFNEKISQHLEPGLIEHCINLLKKIPHLEIKSNINWGGKGEFDIIAYDSIQNNILHFQAKASIPVEGARMTQNLESRIKEGIDQILRFDKETNKDEVVSRIFNKTITNPSYINIILGWGGFGTYKIWKILNKEKIVALNIATLNQYIKKFENNYNLLTFYDDTNKLIQEIIDSSKPKRNINNIKIDKYKISYETFNSENAKLLKYRYVP